MLSMTQLVIWFSQTALMLAAAPFLMPRVSLSEFLPDLEDLANRIGKLEEEGTPDPEKIYALAKVIYSLSMEMRSFFSAEQIIILNENFGVAGGMTPLVILAAALGALGCGFMWQKGISFYEFMYVTKQNMANAVASMMKHLDQISAALAQAKKHLTQRIENSNGKVDERKEIFGEIKNEVVEVRGKVENIGFELNNLQQLLWGLNGRVSSIEDKQNFACAGVMYLCQFVEGKGGNMPDFLMDGPDGDGKRRFLGASEAKQLKASVSYLSPYAQYTSPSNIDEIIQKDTDSLDNLKPKKSLSRTISLKN